MVVLSEESGNEAKPLTIPVYCLPEEVGSVCGCIRNSIYVGLYNDVMVLRRANGVARRCRVLERT